MTPWIRPSSYPAKLYWSWRYVGVRATVIAVVAKPIDRLLAIVRPSLWYQDMTERAFDRRHNVDTYRRIQLDEMTDLPAAQRQEMNEYGPTRAMDFGHAMGGTGLDLSRYAFLDVGSGKGKALLLASAFPFARVDGVELSAPLHDAALENLRRYTGPRRCGPMAAHLGDALHHALPVMPFVCFMFNPFPSSVLQQFLDRLVGEVKADRHVLLIYGNANEAQQVVLDSEDDLRPRWVDADEQYLVYDVNPELRIPAASSGEG